MYKQVDTTNIAKQLRGDNMITILQEYKRGSKFDRAEDLYNFKQALHTEEVGLTEDELAELIEVFD